MNTLVFLLSLRNLLRNKRRTALSLTMLVGAFVALSLSRGFTNKISSDILNITTETMTGHLQIAKKSLWENRTTDTLSEKLILEPDKLSKDIRELNSEIRQTSGRLTLFGLLSNGNQSASVRVVGVNTQAETHFFDHLRFVAGGAWSVTTENPIVLGSGVARALQVQTGDTLTLLTTTVEGGLNGIDLTVSGIASTGFKEFDDISVFTYSNSLEKLFDSEAQDRVLIWISHPSQLESVKEAVAQYLRKHSSDLEIKNWEYVHPIAKHARQFLQSQDIIMMIILGIVVLFSITNTVGISIFERTAEIGTLRALGDTKPDIFRLFSWEAILLAGIACAISFPTLLLAITTIESFNLTIRLPASNIESSISFLLQTQDLLLIGGYIFVITLISVWVPAIKSTKMNIVEALRRSK